MSEKDEFEKKRLFTQLLKTESSMIGFASILGKGIQLTGTEKRKYYRQVGILRKLTIDIAKRGWLEEYKTVGIG